MPSEIVTPNNNPNNAAIDPASMHHPTSNSTSSSTIVHLDVDAFYVACERELRPELCGRPVAVSQYNPYGDLRDCPIDDPYRILHDGLNATAKQHPNANGSLIAVSYEARAQNVRRNDRGLEAVQKCPSLTIVQVPVSNGKACLNLYRDASERLMLSLVQAMKTGAEQLYLTINLAGSDNSGNLEELINNDNHQSTNDNSTINQSTKKALGDIKVEKASVDEIYIDLSLPVQTILALCVSKNHWQCIQQELQKENSVAVHTTVGGLETSEAAIATNSLSKDDIRRGSNLQVLDSAETEASTTQQAWWHRGFPQMWSQEELELAIGSLITLQARQSIEQQYQGIFTLSAGISTNKVLAKLASGLKKPNRQTLIAPSNSGALQTLFHPLPLSRVRGLGGKFGQTVGEMLGVTTVGELAKVPLPTLQANFGDKQAHFLHRMAQGICDEPVTERIKAKRIGAGKTFRGILAIPGHDEAKLEFWVSNLVADIIERVTSDPSRYAKTLTVWLHMTTASNLNSKDHRKRASQSTSLPRNLTAEKCTKLAVRLAQEILQTTSQALPSTSGEKNDPLMIIGMEVSASNFVAIEQGANSIVRAFQRCQQQSSSSTCDAARSTSPRPNHTSRTASIKRPAKKHQPKGIASFVQPMSSDTTSNVDVKTESTGAADCNSHTKDDQNISQDEKVETDRVESEVVEKISGSHNDTASASINNGNADASDLPEFHRSDNISIEPIDATTSVSICHHKEKENNTDAVAAVDPDLEYAKLLQKSFDRENEVLSHMEQRRRQSSSGCKNAKKRRRSSSPAGLTSISNFFVKKK